MSSIQAPCAITAAVVRGTVVKAGRVVLAGMLAVLLAWPSAWATGVPELLLKTGIEKAEIRDKEDINPEIATDRGRSQFSQAAHSMVSSANPLATQVGVDILAEIGREPVGTQVTHAQIRFRT